MIYSKSVVQRFCCARCAPGGGVMVANIVGNLVEGDDFFDRTEDLRGLHEEGHRQNLLLLAPRRVGKTSLLHRLAVTAREQEGWHAIYLSIEGISDEAGFVQELIEKLKSDPAAKPCLKALRSGAIGRFVRGIDKVRFWPPEISRAKSEGFADELKRELRAALRLLPRHWFLLVDEVPLFVVDLLRQDATGERARHFLQWFRRLRQRDVDTVMSLHWVLAGSVGLDTVAEQHGLTDTINDLRIVRLGAFSETNARSFLRELGARYKIPLDEATQAALCERAGWLIPYHLQVLFSEVRELHREVCRAVTADDVETCFSGAVEKSAYFSTWRERLPKELGEARAAWAMVVLDAAARDARGATFSVLSQKLAVAMGDADARERELRSLLRILASDGYLREEEGRWPFRSNLLRGWWRRQA